MKPVLTVSELLTEVRESLLARPSLRSLLLRGEISNFIRSRSGHLYFVLKDQRCQVRCVMFASDARRLGCAPGDGLRVVVSGQVTLYGPRGDLQVQVRALRLDGLGQLYEALEKLKRKLVAEGLFASERKRRLPLLPRTVGVITSLQGAVLHDIVTTLRRRNGAVSVVVSPAPVQGDEAPRRLSLALRRLVHRARPDCVIIARGGGSIEDLMAFNSEEVVRAVAACPVPVLSAVGHETDTTLCDLAADERAPTPTAAAEMVAPPRSELSKQLEMQRHRLSTALAHRLVRQRELLERLASSPVLRYPQRLVEQQVQQLDDLSERLSRALILRGRQERQRLEGLLRSPALRYPQQMFGGEREEVESLHRRLGPAVGGQLSRFRTLLSGLGARLEALSPLRVLDRGYALCLDEHGRPVGSIRGRSPGDRLEVRFSDGSLRSRVEAVLPHVEEA